MPKGKPPKSRGVSSTRSGSESTTRPATGAGHQRFVYRTAPIFLVGVAAVAASWLVGRHDGEKGRPQQPRAEQAKPSARSCIDRLHGLDEVLAQFRSPGGLARPALITGLTENREVRRRWTPDFLRRDPHGREPVNVQQRHALAQTGGNTKTGAELPFTLGRFISEALPTYAGSSNPPYVFDSKSFFASKGGMQLLQSFQMSPVLDFRKWYNTPNADYVLAIGGASTGIPFHFHPAAWLELIKGRKRWWVAPAGSKVQMDVYASPATGDMLADENPHICAFVQEEGDIVYVPDGYFHAVSNDLNWTVAVGQQAPGNAPDGFVDHVGKSTRALMAAAASQRNKDLARTAVRTIDTALSKWPEEPLFHNIRAKIAIDVPEANLEPVTLAEKNVEYNPRSVDARFLLLNALNRHAKHRLEDIERLCLELHNITVAYEQERLQELEDVVGQQRSKRTAVELIMREHGIRF